MSSNKSPNKQNVKAVRDRLEECQSIISGSILIMTDELHRHTEHTWVMLLLDSNMVLQKTD